MRRAALVLVCLLVLVSGCSALNSGDATTTAASDGETTTAAAATPTTASSGITAGITNDSEGSQQNKQNQSNTDETRPATIEADTVNATSAGDDTAGAIDTNAAGSAARTARTGSTNDLTDPPSDRLGWEGGYWYNESLTVTTDDGLNASERAATVNRTMARIERIRELEFTESVPVSVVSREAYQRDSSNRGGDRSAAFRAFDNAKFEALFMIGEDENSLVTQASNRNQSVAGFYSPGNDSIVVISPTETPQLTRSTLSHELVHALQDQRFDISGSPPPTRDGYNARNGAIEGEANYIQRRYEQRCEDGGAGGRGGTDGTDAGGNTANASAGWACLETPSAASAGGGNASDLHFGIYLLQYFPYADGPGFVDAIYHERGWEGVNQLHDALPESTEQVIYPDRYGNDTPTNLSIEDSGGAGWTRVRPEGRVDYATLGQSALSSMFGYTAYDQYNSSAIVSQRELLNIDVTGVNTSDPINYGLDVTDGWDGDRMHVYRNEAGETGYVWKLAWDSPAEAEEFVAGYEALLSHWGGEPTGEGTWSVAEDSPFTDAFSIQQEGDTVTIVNAPTTEDIDALP